MKFKFKKIIIFNSIKFKFKLQIRKNYNQMDKINPKNLHENLTEEFKTIRQNNPNDKFSENTFNTNNSAFKCSTGSNRKNLNYPFKQSGSIYNYLEEEEIIKLQKILEERIAEFKLKNPCIIFFITNFFHEKNISFI